MGQRVAAGFARVLAVAVRPLPHLAGVRLAAQAVMVRRRRSDGLAAHLWLRGLLLGVAGRV